MKTQISAYHRLILILISITFFSSLQAQRDVLWIGGLMPEPTVFHKSLNAFSNDFQINDLLKGEVFFADQGVDASVSVLLSVADEGSNILGVAHDYSGIIMRRLQLETPNISAMILNGVPNNGSRIIAYAIDNAGNSDNLTSMESLAQALRSTMARNCDDCGVLDGFSALMQKMENMREQLLYVVPDGQVETIPPPTVPTALLWGDHQQSGNDAFLYSILSASESDSPSTTFNPYGECVKAMRLKGESLTDDIFQRSTFRATSNYISNLLRQVGNYISSGGEAVSDYILEHLQTGTLASEIEKIRRQNSELASIMQCDLANQSLALRYITILTNLEVKQSDFEIPKPPALMACYMDCLAQGNNTSYCNSFCDPQYVTQQQIPLWEFAPNDGLYSKDEQLLDGATVTIRLAGVNHFDEPKWAHPTVRQAYEDLFNGSAGPAFVIPPK